jgi:tetratricopeptide (TPR) repeat protein
MGAEMPELPEIHEIHHHAHGDRFGRAIAIVTVAATLCAAWTAVLQANAIRHHDEAAARAQELAAETLGVRSTSEGAARVQLERFELADQQRARAALARQELLFATGSRARELHTQEVQWDDIAKQTDAQSNSIAEQDNAKPLVASGPFGPSSDATFPLRYLAQSRFESYVLSAERQGANRKATRAESQYSAFAVSFTMLAIAVFLFGYSLTPHGRPRRRLFAGTASAFVVVAATYAIVTTLKAPTEPPKAAAEAYAAGQVAADSSHPAQAVEHFTKAIKLDPGFADAYVGRADAAFLASAPQALGSGASVTTSDALEKVIADERKARSLGVRDPLFYAELGSDLLALGLHNHDRGNLEEAASLLAKAAKQNQTDPQTTYDLGAARVALGRYAAADQAFEQAVERTMFVEGEHGAKPERRDDPVSEEEDLSVGMQDLQNVADRSGGDVAKHAEEAKQKLIEETAKLRIAEEALARGQAAPKPGGEGGAAPQLQGVKLQLAPAATFFQIPAQEGFDPTKDRLSAQWYFQDPKRLGWSVLSEVSSVSEDPLPKGASPTYHERGPYLGLTTPAACLPAGQYRLELYVNGKLAFTGNKSMNVPRKAASLRGLGAGLCMPSDWRQSSKRMPGLVDGYRSPDGSSGSYVFSLSPALIGAGQITSAAEASRILDRVLVRFRDLLPQTPTNPQAGGPDVPNLPGALIRSYRLGSGRMLAAIGQTPDQQLLVELVYGPQPTFADGTASSIFSSLADRS